MANNGNGAWKTIRNIGLSVAIVGGIIAAITATLIMPVRNCAEEAKDQANLNREDISEIKGDMKALKTHTEDTDKNIERLLGILDVPTVREVPSGGLPTDPGEVKESE